MPTVFFSWQRDTRSTEGRNFIERALERAVAIVAADLHLEEAVRAELEVDSDTRGVAGQPPIVETIFRKIENAAVFVPDLTFVGTRRDGRPTPNPNVLIEYGYALRALGHSRIVAVMNAAHGGPGEDMPFDMRHLRWPILYNLPDGAEEADRRTERERLARLLAEAIRTVLASDSYRASLQVAAAPPPFLPASAANGPARFRAPDEPLGVTADTFPLSLITPPREMHLKDGPAIWLRLMPATSPEREWSLNELRKAATDDSFLLLPIRRGYKGYDYLRAQDGFGVCAAVRDGSATCGVVFAFTTGEVWTADSCLVADARQSDRPGLPTMEQEFKASLDQYARFLRKLGLECPFRWIAGYEGIRGLGLYYDPPPGKYFMTPGPFGSSVADIVQCEGILEEGMSAAQALKPLFTKLFDVCGRERGDYLDEMHNP